MPFGPGDDIRKAVEQLLTMDDGFVIFDDGNDLEYVQYSTDGKELILMWPADGPRVTSTTGAVASLLESLDFKKVTDLADLPPKTYVVEDDGIYASFGADADLVENFTTAAFERVYGRLGLQKLKIRVDS
jgi:hypothetical protein